MRLLMFFSQFVFMHSISIISVSSLEKCINSGQSKDISCKTKMVLSLTVQNAELENNDYVETTIDQVTDKDGKIQKFSSPIKITFFKSPVVVQYPLTYFRDFNYLPKEIVAKSTSSQCKDGPKDSQPTCGWVYSGNQKVEYSQGFCCSCSFMSLSTSTKRGTNCGKFFETSASAHCLRFDPLWFSAYKIENHRIDYNIIINITNTYDNSTISSLRISPRDTITTNEEKTILVKLIGDFMPTDIIPRDYSNKYLCIPSKPEDHLYVKQGKFRWMLIDKTRFTLDGSECDKIGVGFYGFQTQREKCNVEVGSCLKNQLSNLYDEDTARLYYGKNTEYLLVYDKNYKYNFHDEGPSSRSFSYNLKGNINTLLTLEIDTSIIKFTVNVSSGKIINLYVNSGFMAMSDDGFMEISITNTGFFTASFTVSYDCNNGLFPLTADEIFLEPGQIKSYNKSLYTRYNNKSIYTCIVYLKDSNGERTDMKMATFNTTTEVLNNKQDYQNHNNVTIINDKDKHLTCKELCMNFDLLCYFKNSCWKLLIKNLCFTFGIIFIALFILKFYKKLFFCCKCIMKIFCCCCICLKGKSRKKNSDDDTELNIL